MGRPWACGYQDVRSGIQHRVDRAWSALTQRRDVDLGQHCPDDRVEQTRADLRPEMRARRPYQRLAHPRPPLAVPMPTLAASDGVIMDNLAGHERRAISSSHVRSGDAFERGRLARMSADLESMVRTRRTQTRQSLNCGTESCCAVPAQTNAPANAATSHLRPCAPHVL